MIDDEEEEDMYDAVAKYRENHPELMVEKPTAWDLLRKANKVIQSMKLSMLVHPDCSRNSEFYDICQTAQEMEDEIDSFLNKETK